MYSTGGASCDRCNDGYLCPEGSNTPTPAGSQCKPGFYCKDYNDGSLRRVIMIPCDKGKYNPAEGSTDSSACVGCLDGYYCPVATIKYE